MKFISRPYVKPRLNYGPKTLKNPRRINHEEGAQQLRVELRVDGNLYLMRTEYLNGGVNEVSMLDESRIPRQYKNEVPRQDKNGVPGRDELNTICLNKGIPCRSGMKLRLARSIMTMTCDTGRPKMIRA